MSEEERRIAEHVAHDPSQQAAKQAHDRRIRHEVKGRRAQVALQEHRQQRHAPPSTLIPPTRPARAAASAGSGLADEPDSLALAQVMRPGRVLAGSPLVAATASPSIP